MLDYELGVIGAGNMATAILRGVIETDCLPKNAIVAYDPDVKREQLLALEFGILCAQSLNTPGSCPRILLSVKPQVMDSVLEAIADTIRPDTTVISIAAGITTEHIDRKLGGKGHIVRVMPNTPMLVRCGVSAIAGGPRATPEDVHWVQRLFAASGLTIVMDESMLDAVTGLSGSGPAYLFYLIEAMTEAGVREGIDPDIAGMMATQTCIGAGKLLAQTGRTPAELRRMVTTPGGTTEAAVNHLDAREVRESIAAAISAATARSRELGK
jgi:pyrroline-5-carboxylate reductase